MTPDLVALGRRVVACRGWSADPVEAHTVGEIRCAGTGVLWRWDEDVWIPSLDDSATLGVLLGLVREAWRDPGVWLHRLSGSFPSGVVRWDVLAGERADDLRKHGSRPMGYRLASGATEIEALVAALEAAP